MDIMRPLRVRIDVTNGTATPAQPDPQTIHLNAAQQQKNTPQQNAVPQPPASQQQEAAMRHATPSAASRSLLLQTTDIPGLSAATTLGPLRTSTSVLRMLCRRL